MPVFAEHPGDSPDNILSALAIELIVDWLRGEWYEPPEKPAAEPADSTEKTVASK